MIELHQFFRFYLIFCFYIQSARSLCKMPRAWLGSWYQHGMNSLLEINIDHIQSKGTCLEVLSDQHYYLFLERSNRCLRCLLLIERHPNLLQYRESDCHDMDDLVFNVTSCPHLIAPDAVLYTLHRNNSKSELCPIHPPYKLNQLIKDGTVCHGQSISLFYINQCASNDQFHLYLPPCLSYHRTLDRRYVCVATWFDQFHTYFVARTNDHYSCFRYVTGESSLSLSMAIDDSCHDLNWKQMSTVMRFSSKTSKQSCHFPESYQSIVWSSINRTIQMKMIDDRIELKGTIQRRFDCLQMIDNDTSIYLYRIRSLTECHMNEECLQIIHRTDDVIELVLMRSMSCQSISESDETISWTFIKDSHLKTTNSMCPTYLGRLTFQSDVDYYLKRKSLQMSVGCDQSGTVEISSGELNEQWNERERCRATWQSSDRLITYLLIQSEQSKNFYCLSFQLTNPIIIRNNSNGCSFNHRFERHSISIYSGHRLSSCSNSGGEYLRLTSFYIWLTIISNIVHNVNLFI